MNGIFATAFFFCKKKKMNKRNILRRRNSPFLLGLGRNAAQLVGIDPFRDVFAIEEALRIHLGDPV